MKQIVVATLVVLPLSAELRRSLQKGRWFAASLLIVKQSRFANHAPDVSFDTSRAWVVIPKRLIAELILAMASMNKRQRSHDPARVA
jgi:hypothetical protein